VGKGNSPKDRHFGRRNYKSYYKYCIYIFPPSSFPFTEITPAPTHTMIKTISKRRVLSLALVAELKTLKRGINIGVNLHSKHEAKDERSP